MEYDTNFDELTRKINPLEAPQAANELVAQTLSQTSTEPIIEPPADGYVLLPAGLMREGEAVREAMVRELTGADEERLERSRANAARYLATLLACGVESIGNGPVTPAVLSELLLGDQETLVLAIRRATFGQEIKLSDVACPHCSGSVTATINLSEITIKELEDPAKREFEVELRAGTAIVRLPTVGDQEKVFAKANSTVAEQNTLLLSRCVLRLLDAKGEEQRVDVRKMGAKDRATILEFLTETQPGPRYDDIKFTHEECGREVSIPLTLAELFRGF